MPYPGRRSPAAAAGGGEPRSRRKDRARARAPGYAAIGLPHLRTNAGVSGSVLEDVARPDIRGPALLRDAALGRH
jgi:magnesium chelatase family protein